MDIKLTLIYCMTLLYRESITPHQERSAALCQEVANAIVIPENNFELQTPREVAIGLKNTLQWMLRETNQHYQRAQLLQRIRIVTRDESHLYDAFIDGIESESGNEEAIKKQIIRYREILRDYVNRHKVQTIITNAFHDFNHGMHEATDYRQFVRLVHKELEPFLLNTHDTTHPAIVDQVNFEQEANIEAMLKRSKEEISTDGVLKTGYQAINRMLGDTGGFRRGEMAVIGALQHHFKTGFTLNLFKHFALYNTPYLRDPEKKPLLLHVSLENELPMNLLWLYANLKENETGEFCEISNIDVREAALYVQQRLSVNGYHIEMLRLEPGQCTVNDLFELLLKYEAQGYEIHAVVCDYLNMMSKQGLNTTGPAGEDIRELFRRVRNFCAPRGITFITPHQLSSEAKMLTRQRVERFVREIANKGYYDGSKRIDQEVDLEIYIHIEKEMGRGSFLTCQRGKHRGIKITPEKHLYCVLPFNAAGGVLDDINGEDRSCESVGGRSLSQGGGHWVDNH